MSCGPRQHPAPRVLLVEDDRLTRTVVKECLRQEGFDVVCAANGEVALAKLGITESAELREPFSLVLTDIYMPKLDGAQLIQSIRGSEKYQSLPVAVMSSDNSPEAKKRALEIGAKQYLVKPIGREQLARLHASVMPITAPALGSSDRSPPAAPPIAPATSPLVSADDLPLLRVVGLRTGMEAEPSESVAVGGQSFVTGVHAARQTPDTAGDAYALHYHFKSASTPSVAPVGLSLRQASLRGSVGTWTQSLPLPDAVCVSPPPSLQQQSLAAAHRDRRGQGVEGGQGLGLAGPFMHPPPSASPLGQLPFLSRSSSEPPLDTLSPTLSPPLPLQTATSVAALRKAALERFRLKKAKRQFAPKVRYAARKKLAEARPRFKGQFVKAAKPPVDGDGVGLPAAASTRGGV